MAAQGHDAALATRYAGVVYLAAAAIMFGTTPTLVGRCWFDAAVVDGVVVVVENAADVVVGVAAGVVAIFVLLIVPFARDHRGIVERIV